jgi:hypothetical protein
VDEEWSPVATLKAKRRKSLIQVAGGGLMQAHALSKIPSDRRP